MSKLQEKLAAIRALKAKAEPKKEKPRYRVRDGKVVLRMYAVLAKPEPKKPVSNVRDLVSGKFQHLQYDRQPVQVGSKCDHCMPGRPGRYKNPLTGEIGKCWPCNGKGIFDARDLAFDNARRRGERGPICHMRSAA